MPEIVQGKELTQSADTHHAAYDEPDISHESPERVDEAHQVLEDEGGVLSQEAQYVREVTSNQIKELSTRYEDFNAVVVEDAVFTCTSIKDEALAVLRHAYALMTTADEIADYWKATPQAAAW